MPPRRSSRRSTATKKGPQDPTVAFVSTDGGQPKTALGANKSKKRKVVKEIPNKPQVVKCAVANLSVELFLEVGSYCDLADLLNLSRANKWLHGVFSSRSASSCWKQAAQNEQSEGLPPCPDDLNLRRYVSLMMDQHCERCDEDDGYNTVLWAARERLCRRCIKTHYRAALPNFLLPNMYGYEKLMAIKIYLPDERHYHYGHIRGATRYAVKEIKLLKEVVPGMSVGELAKMMGLIVGKRAKENNAVHTVWLYGRYQAVAEERHAIEQKAYQKNLELSLKLERERESKRKAAVEKRWEAIKAKLTEAGFDDVLTVEVCTSLVRQRQSVNQEHRFIDKEWSELRKEPIPILNDLRIKLAEHRRKDVLVVRLVQLKSLIDEVTTSDADFANIPSCHYANFAMDSVVEDKIRKFPGNGELSPEVLDIMREKCTSKKLRQDFEWRLTRQFPSLAKQHEDQSLSHHPLALFRCDSCNAGKTDPLTSITVMHPCLCNRFTPRTLSLLEKVPGGAYDYGVRENSGAMKHLIELGSIDPALGTAQDMDEADFFVQCHSCKNKVRGMTMGWRTAFHHMSTTHSTGNLDLRLAGEEETKLAQTLTKETEKTSREAHEKLSLWQCVLCPANKRIPILKPELVVHLKHEHRRTDMREGENHERDPQSPPYVPHAVALLPRGSDKNLKETEKQWLEQGYARMMKK